MLNGAGLIGTIITDADQRIVHIDDRYVEIVGRQPSEMIGKKALSFTYVNDLQANQLALDRLAVGGPGFSIVKRYIRSDGGLVWVKNHVTRVAHGKGLPVICATTQPIDRPFGTEQLTRNYKTAQRLCIALIAGKRQLTSDVVFAPAIEALLWLYRAEIEGHSLDTEKLAALTGSALSVMARCLKLLQERNLVVVENSGTLTDKAYLRISIHGERKLDDLLVIFSA